MEEQLLTQGLILYERLVLLGRHWIITYVRISHFLNRIYNIHEIIHCGRRSYKLTAETVEVLIY